MSLAHALSLLGYRSLHFPQDDRTKEQVMEYLATAGDRLRLAVLERLDALTDTPICASYEGLDAAYPGSKFILTTRDKDSWLESCRAYWASWVDSYLLARPNDPLPAYLIPIHAKIYGTPTFDREQFSRAYDHYHERVRRHFAGRSEDLLTLNICAGEGWDPLCRFLGLPQPRAEFPSENRTPPGEAGDAATE
jgi:sulfotransferase family protein